MTLDPTIEIARAKNSISAFSNATSFNMTSAPRKRVGELLTFLHDSIPNEAPNIEFLNCIHQLQTTYDTNFSDDAFSKRYDFLPVTVAIKIPLGQASLEKARDTICKNLKNINATDWQLTKLERLCDAAGVEYVTTTANTKIRYSETDLDALQNRAQAQCIPGMEYSVTTNRSKPNLNEGLGDLVTQTLYLIRLHLHCIELFDQKNKYTQLKQTLEEALEDHVAPLVCPDVFYYDKFVTAFKETLPTLWQKIPPTAATLHGKEAVYYSEFAFECSGNADPKAKTKIVNRKKRKETKNPAETPEPVDFLEYLIMSSKILMKEGVHRNGNASIAHAVVGKHKVKDFSSIVINTHCQILMDLQNFLWTHYDVAVGETLGLYLEEYISQAFCTFYEDLTTKSIPFFASRNIKDNIEGTFVQLKTKLIGHGQNLVAIVDELLTAQNDSKYSKYYNFKHEIESTLWYMMQFWFYFKKTNTIEQLIDLFVKVPKEYEIRQQMSDFILKNINDTRAETNEHHLQFAANLIEAEEHTKKINPKLTPFLQKLLLEKKNISNQITFDENNSPKNLCKSRNHFLLTQSKKQQQKHLIMNFELMWEMLADKLSSPGVFAYLAYGQLKSIKTTILNSKEVYSQRPNDIEAITHVISTLDTLNHDRRLPSAGNPLHQELQLLVLQTIIDTEDYKVDLIDKDGNKYKKYPNTLLASILQKMPIHSPLTNVLIDELWLRQENPDTQLSPPEQHQLLQAILANKVAQKKYYSRMHTLYVEVSQSYEIADNSDERQHNLKDRYDESKANPPKTLPTLSIWARLKGAYNFFKTQKTSLYPDPVPRFETIHDAMLAKFCNKPLKMHQASFYKNTKSPQTVSEERSRLFYTQLRVELSQFLMMQQYIHEMEIYNGCKLPDDTSIRIQDAPYAQIHKKNARWIKCLEKMPPSKINQHPLQRIDDQPYQQASIIAEALTRETTLGVQAYLEELTPDGPKTVEMQIAAAARVCLEAFKIQNVVAPTEQISLQKWAATVGNDVLIKAISNKYENIMTNVRRGQGAPTVDLKVMGPSLVAALTRSVSIARAPSVHNLTASVQPAETTKNYDKSRRSFSSSPTSVQAAAAAVNAFTVSADSQPTLAEDLGHTHCRV